MTDHKERFLEAEEQASRLAAQMQELKSKIDAHEEATSSLNEARNAIASLTGELAEISQELPAVISTLSEIGTPAILQSVETSRTNLSNSIKAGFERISRLLWITIVLSVTILFGLLVLIVLVLTRLR